MSMATRFVTEGWTRFCVECGGNREAHDHEMARLERCPWKDDLDNHPKVHDIARMILCETCKKSRVEHDLDVARVSRHPLVEACHKCGKLIGECDSKDHVPDRICGTCLQTPEHHEESQRALRPRRRKQAKLHDFGAVMICSRCEKSPEEHAQDQERLKACRWKSDLRRHARPHPWTPHGA